MIIMKIMDYEALTNNCICLISEPTLHVMEGPGSEQTEWILQREPLHGSVGSHHQPAWAMKLQKTRHLSRNRFYLYNSVSPPSLCGMQSIEESWQFPLWTGLFGVYSPDEMQSDCHEMEMIQKKKTNVFFNFQLVGRAHGLFYVNVW